MFKKIFCFINIHDYEYDNSGVLDDYISFFKCKKCYKCLLMFYSEYMLRNSSVEKILEDKLRYDLVQERNVLIEKC